MMPPPGVIHRIDRAFPGAVVRPKAASHDPHLQQDQQIHRQGQLAAIAFLKEHPEVADELVAVVREKASAAGGKEASWRASA